VRIDDEAGNVVRLVGTIISSRNRVSGTSARRVCAAARSAAEDAAVPASSSPERRGDALAITSRRSVKE